MTLVAITCCTNLARRTPHNYIALFVFTIAESFLVGVISAVYEYRVVLTAVLITVVICVGLTMFAFQTKVDFTIYNGLLFVLCLVLMIFGFTLMFWKSSVAHLVYSCLGALLFSAVRTIVDFSKKLIFPPLFCFILIFYFYFL